MKKKRFEGKIPTSFQSRILMRFMTESQMTTFYNQYLDAQIRVHGTSMPSELQFKIAKEAKASGIPAAEKKHSVKRQQVYQAIRRVAMYEFMK